MTLLQRSAEVPNCDERGFIHEYIACRINAVIEVLNLPVELLTDAAPDSIRNKLLELSDDEQYWETPEARIVWLEDVINKLCDNGEMIARVEYLTREKLKVRIRLAESA